MATIESLNLSIEKLFNDFYIIPDYQREYIWKDKQIDEFFQDIYEEFIKWENISSISPSQTIQYFIGSIIVYLRNDKLYEVIDGQQRITTAYIFLCAIRDYLKMIKPSESTKLLSKQISDTTIDRDGNDISRYRVTLQYRDSIDVLNKLADSQNLDNIENTASAQNIKNAYENILKSLKDNFDNNKQSVINIKRFYAFFIQNVFLVRTKTDTLADALRVFATINNRGVNLDAIDLVKNLMFIKAQKHDYDDLKTKWKKMVDILYDTNEDPMRFLNYFLLSFYSETESLKKSEI